MFLTASTCSGADVPQRKTSWEYVHYMEHRIHHGGGSPRKGKVLALMVWFFFLLLTASTCPWDDVPIFCSWKWKRKCGFYLYGM